MCSTDSYLIINPLLECYFSSYICVGYACTCVGLCVCVFVCVHKWRGSDSSILLVWGALLSHFLSPLVLNICLFAPCSIICCLQNIKCIILHIASDSNSFCIYRLDCVFICHTLLILSYCAHRTSGCSLCSLEICLRNFLKDKDEVEVLSLWKLLTSWQYSGPWGLLWVQLLALFMSLKCNLHSIWCTSVGTAFSLSRFRQSVCRLRGI